MTKIDKNFPNQIRRETVNTFLKEILSYEPQNQEHIYYRGESNFYPMRTPSLYLEKYLTENGSEYYYRTLLNELGREDYRENTSLVRLISELQHYGAKTRMLDVTKNPLVALYFAVEKEDKDPGYVFIYKEDMKNEKFNTGHTVAIKSALNFIPQEITNNSLEACEMVELELKPNKVKNYKELSTNQIAKY